VPQGVRVVLVLVPAGDLEDALAQQRLQAVLAASLASAWASQGRPPSLVTRSSLNALPSGSA
jgi:hypothetical protein